MKFAVLGGTGFLGQRVCHQAQRLGNSVLALSRRSAPVLATTATSRVQHVPFDITAHFQGQGDAVQLTRTPPDDVLAQLQDCTVAVHALGTLLDSDAYKTIAKARNASELSLAMQRWFQSASSATSAPGLYERLNRDSAIAFALICARFMPNIKHFVFVSTADQLLPAPFNCAIDKRYWTTKRHVETVLMRDRLPGDVRMAFSRSIVRPGWIPILQF
jgi:hypothetical protein